MAIISDKSIGQGTRRVIAVCGEEAKECREYVKVIEKELAEKTGKEKTAVAKVSFLKLKPENHCFGFRRSTGNESQCSTFHEYQSSSKRRSSEICCYFPHVDLQIRPSFLLLNSHCSCSRHSHEPLQIRSSNTKHWISA